MTTQIRKADYVLVVCTKDYCDKANRDTPGGDGVKFESLLTCNYLCKHAAKNGKFIPVLLSASDVQFRPDPLESFTYFNVGVDRGYLALYRLLSNQPDITAPPLGEGLELPPALPGRSSLVSVYLGKPATPPRSTANREERGPKRGAPTRPKGAKHARNVAERSEPIPIAEGVDLLAVEVGYGLAKMVDRAQGGNLRERIEAMRRQLVEGLGIVIPPIGIRDNTPMLGANDYVIKVKGVKVASGSVYLDHYLAMDAGLATGKLQGMETKEPAFGLPATWISLADRDRAEGSGYTVVDAALVVATHLTETIKTHAGDILTWQRVQDTLDSARRTSPALVKEVTPALLKVGEIRRVLQNLLRERVSIRDIETILETLADHAGRTRDTEILTEYVRNSLRRWISGQYEEAGTIHVVTLAPTVEKAISAAMQRTDSGSYLTLAPAMAKKITDATAKQLERLLSAGHLPVVLTSPQIRSQFRKFMEGGLPSIIVLAYNEIPQELEVTSMGMVKVTTLSQKSSDSAPAFAYHRFPSTVCATPSTGLYQAHAGS
jgi:flagellar biosynthesis component FlhA